MSARTAKLSRVLFLAQSCANFDAMLISIQAAGFAVAIAYASDEAVAVCLSNHFAAVVLDAALIRNDDWSVAKSLKLIKPTLPILLLDRRNATRRDTLPPNIDALANGDDPRDVLLKLKGLLPHGSPRQKTPRAVS